MSAGQFTSDVTLGERYRDSQTGVEGVATAVHFYQYGCERITIEVLVKGHELHEYTFDSPRLVHVESEQRMTSKRTGGPEKATDSRSVPPR